MVCERIFNILLRPNILFRFSNLHKVRQELQLKVFTFISAVIEKRRETISSDDNETDIFINRILKAQSVGQFTDSDVYGETASMIIAGNETIATAISFTILMLAMNEKIQEKVFQEINEIFPTNNFDIDYNDLQNMEYTEMVLKETLRLFPPGPFFGRKVTAELKIGMAYIYP